jgi:putative oxidoreductase
MRAELDVREWGMAILRVVIGIAFMMHGGQKLFVLGSAGSAGIMVRAGIPLPWLAGPFIAVVEFFGGVALVLGILSRWAALLLACDMTVAILKVNIHRGFFGPGGVELPLILLAASCALAAYGPGLLSLEAVAWGRKTSPASTQEPAANRPAGGAPLRRSAR